MSHDQPDLAELLAFQRPTSFEVWIDPLSPATALLLPYIDLDGHAHGGRPWRFRGHDEVAMRLLPEPGDDLSALAARCILAVKAWAVQRSRGDTLVPMDYDLPWGYLGNLLRDLDAVRVRGLPHMVALAGREGDWLGDWVAEYREHPAIHDALNAEIQTAQIESITDAPSLCVGDLIYEPASMPDDINDQVALILDRQRAEQQDLRIDIRGGTLQERLARRDS